MNKLTNISSCITNSIIWLLIIYIFLPGCTTLQPIEMDSNTLQDKIRNGEIVNVGDRVRVVTQEGDTHIFTVLAINEHTLKGELEDTGTETKVIEIPIDDIDLIEGEKFNAPKTIFSIGGGLLGVFVLFMGAVLLFAT
ncbi:MAG: hypothetical protein JSU75_07435 [Gammaproteobacteria bacterium]|nr:MAG: hypothetical protein JSU75_07435 [Gammaproteobacteria bacterium]